ncbi:hypothetical protein [Trichoplusia ni ascovirus 2c]|uniref:hypothetical protein n=1 Tax=Trichoplusia ni ascovirus 2c TaxID=328615 RepID=UPI0000E44235|nr:hypothetical protein TNAV2c_gp093 [Trichoplusia ni ascovirus 2c]ABF70610.1 hypothetical protein [Trichoplusia ni ascovirus 2c]AUS94199.1 CTD phosphatase [Trichoplusia ni ascovirus 6b]
MLSRDKPTIFLDLDHTLICAYKQNSEDTELAKNVNFLTPIISFANYDVYKRPHVDKFLKFLFRNFYVAVWTAASNEYAAVITSKVILGDSQTRNLDMFLTDEDTKEAHRELGGVKNLDAIWALWGAHHIIKEGLAVIVDDLPDVMLTQPDKCIHVKPFIASASDAVIDDGLLIAMDEIRSRYL